ncbi:hypothetical protein Goshw_004909, partial [Gossypium schwendimanii]|nr:hypothetical protein [Gossypium schwendimanii]
MECCFFAFSSRGDNSNHWRPLAIGFVKFNMDGSSRGCLRKTAIGGVLEDKNGCVLALFLGPMGEGDAANAKLLAIENVLKHEGSLVKAIGSMSFMYVSMESQM